MTVKETRLVREDNLFMPLEALTEVEEEFFSIEVGKTSSRTDSFHTRYQLEFYFDHDVTQIERVVYNSFMLLGDIGGFYGILVSVFSLINSLLNYHNAANYLVEQLYSKPTSESKTLLANKQYALKEYV